MSVNLTIYVRVIFSVHLFTPLVCSDKVDVLMCFFLIPSFLPCLFLYELLSVVQLFSRWSVHPRQILTIKLRHKPSFSTINIDRFACVPAREQLWWYRRRWLFYYHRQQELAFRSLLLQWPTLHSHSTLTASFFSCLLFIAQSALDFLPSFLPFETCPLCRRQW